MKKTGIAILICMAGAVAVALLADQPAAAPAASAAKMNPEECAKRCKEMGAAHAKMTESQKAAQAKQDAAWKEIQADLASAKKATGEKKVAALESVVEKLVAFHGEMHQGDGAHAMMASMGGHGMDCCAGEGHKASGMMCDHDAPAAASAPAPPAKK